MKKVLLANLLLGCSLFSSFAFSEIAVIVNPSNANAVDVDEIKRIFLGKQSSFADGSLATPIDQPEGSAPVEEFNQKVLSRSSSQLKAYWSKLIFTGKGKPPQKLGSDAEVIKAVASEADKIGYVNASAVDGSVKVLMKL
ncbi:phosphate ABC transporter substrate-binding protein [Alteromonas sp. a30]|uniref:phosphate ABC transporter substrate-binding protein n=1 Tax=Alteromonas sp. a30 TaxID=2730917 RepID=UPI00228186F1|nr:phosphate ABC transporter substrate-binding protein [Alteromonas sp. a30]MCY7295919.1 phosphate ABC transporter substrate-binding protein [Alteromonas sp. a30]